MYYCVVPRELESELLRPLRSHYANEPEIEVIIDRRRRERRRNGEPVAQDRRVLRDRRRRRVCGEFLALRGERRTP